MCVREREGELQGGREREGEGEGEEGRGGEGRGGVRLRMRRGGGIYCPMETRAQASVQLPIL